MDKGKMKSISLKETQNEFHEVYSLFWEIIVDIAQAFQVLAYV